MPSAFAHSSRRGFLLGTGLAVLGAAGGLTAGLLAHRSPDDSPVPDPAVLHAAVGAERDAIAALDDALASGSSGVAASLLRAMRRDHQAHLTALVAAVAIVVGSPSPSTPPAVRPGGQSLSRTQLAARERRAAHAAAQHALALTGRDATLLASIAACEASHAELLS